MSDRKNEIFSLNRDDGTTKSKEEFIKELSEFYDQTIEADKEYRSGVLFKYCTTPLTQINPQDSLTTFDFLNRTIRINEDITDATAKRVVSLINFYASMDDADGLTAEEREDCPINLMIDTCGGDLWAAFSIIDAIRTSCTPVITYNTGKAFSAGFLIFISGDYRITYPRATFLFHEGYNSCANVANKFINYANFYEKKVIKDIRALVLEVTDISADEYESHRNDDWWLTAKEAKKFKIADEISTTASLIINEDCSGGTKNEQ